MTLKPLTVPVLAVALAVALLAAGLFLAQRDPHGGGNVPAPIAELIGVNAADAHHTHSPTTACGSTVWYLNSHGYSYTWLSSWNHYDSTGHPIWAVCNFRDNRTFGQVKWCFRYYDHVIWRCTG